MPSIGSPAPAFELPDQDGQRVALRDLAGSWVVLYFYPRDDTPGCTVEACEFTAANEAFRALGAHVLGCSPDGAAAHRKFIDKHRLGVRLLSDADRSVMRAYGAYGTKVLYGKQTVGVIRSTVLIDPEGRVAAHWKSVKAAGHAAAVRSRLEELRAQQRGDAATAQSTSMVASAKAVTATKKPAANAVKTTKTVKAVKAVKASARKPAATASKATSAKTAKSAKSAKAATVARAPAARGGRKPARTARRR